MSGLESPEREDFDDRETGIVDAALWRRWFDSLCHACKIEVLIFLTRRPSGRRCIANQDCHRGGIGRRAWFRSMYRQRCGGSSPFDGTKEEIMLRN